MKPMQLLVTFKHRYLIALAGPRSASLTGPHADSHLAVHKDVKANPKHLEEVPVVGPVLYEVPGKP